MMNKLKRIFPAVAAALLFPCALGAIDTRNIPVDMYLIIDGSSSISEAKDEAFAWIAEELIDSILQKGDSLSIWTVQNSAELVYKSAISDDTEKKAVKTLLNSIKPDGTRPDFEGALAQAEKQAAAQKGNRFAYTILVSGAISGLSAEEDGGLLRYSKVEEFSGWRVLYVALGIKSRVRQAASAFMR
jgi:hypothetical protein